MAKKKKDKKKYHKSPPLSGTDKRILTFAFFGMLGLFFVLVLGTMFLPKIADVADHSAVAVKGSGFTAILISFLCLAVALLFGKLLPQRPIFGNPRVDYTDPKWEGVYPLYDKRYPVKKKNVLTMTALFLLLVITMICVVFAFFHMADRKVLQDNGDIVVYDGFHTETHDAEDISEMKLYTYYQKRSGRRSFKRSHLRFDFDLTMKDGTRFFFDADCFATLDDALTYTQMLKDMVGKENVTIEDRDRLDDVIRDGNYSKSQAERLYELFE